MRTRHSPARLALACSIGLSLLGVTSGAEAQFTFYPGAARVLRGCDARCSTTSACSTTCDIHDTNAAMMDGSYQATQAVTEASTCGDYGRCAYDTSHAPYQGSRLPGFCSTPRPVFGNWNRSFGVIGSDDFNITPTLSGSWYVNPGGFGIDDIYGDAYARIGMTLFGSYNVIAAQVLASASMEPGGRATTTVFPAILGVDADWLTWSGPVTESDELDDSPWTIFDRSMTFFEQGIPIVIGARAPVHLGYAIGVTESSDRRGLAAGLTPFLDGSVAVYGGLGGSVLGVDAYIVVEGGLHLLRLEVPTTLSARIDSRSTTGSLTLGMRLSTMSGSVGFRGRLGVAGVTFFDGSRTIARLGGYTLPNTEELMRAELGSCWR